MRLFSATCACLTFAPPGQHQLPAVSNLTSPLQQTGYLQGNPAFLEKVTVWQRKLGAVDMVLSGWTDVQRKWQGLQSIFVGSADIRVQLPEDSARFDTLNIDYKVRRDQGLAPAACGIAKDLVKLYLLCPVVATDSSTAVKGMYRFDERS